MTSIGAGVGLVIAANSTMFNFQLHTFVAAESYLDLCRRLQNHLSYQRVYGKSACAISTESNGVSERNLALRTS